MPKEVTPYQSSDSKKNQVRSMFNNIAKRYDFLNRLLSLGIDRGWRKKAIQLINAKKANNILDVATGTGDLAIELAQNFPKASIHGLDLAAEMLAVGEEKIQGKQLKQRIFFKEGDAENLPYETNTFDAATIAFGVRNFETPVKGLKEINRVLKPGGQIIVLEFSKTQSKVFDLLFNFYFKYILPTIGRLISKDAKAYTYLYDSVQAFPSGDAFLEVLKEADFNSTKTTTLTFGVCSIYYGEK
ncbi:MAG: bifunctional demethylmenaquinone methyltransferase/2-methoxy-6-polyprenyl-1,4-benzoquinol methylase UbiE, partial [Bacteroidota bacterium]